MDPFKGSLDLKVMLAWYPWQWPASFKPGEWLLVRQLEEFEVLGLGFSPKP